jgi:hypothetical protein
MGLSAATLTVLLASAVLVSVSSIALSFVANRHERRSLDLKASDNDRENSIRKK